MADQQVGGLNQASAPPPAQPTNQDIASDAIASNIQDVDYTAPETPAVGSNQMDDAFAELRRGRAQLDAQIQRLKLSLDKRMNPPFDPMWMKMAAGFLKPTKTGSFGESLGYAAEGASDEAEKNIERQAQIEKLKLELEEKGFNLKKSGAQMEHMLRMAGYSPEAIKVMTSTSGTAPSVVNAGAGSTATPAGVGQAAPASPMRTMRQITDSDITAAYAIDKAYGDEVANIAKMQREDIVSGPGGMYSKSQQKYITRTATPIEIQLPNGSMFKTTAENADLYTAAVREAVEKNDPSVVTAALRKIGAIAPSGEKPTGLELPESPAEKEGKIEESKVYAKSSAELAGQLQISGSTANDLRNAADSAITLAKSNPRAFKLLENADVRDAYNKFLSAAKIGTPWGSFSLPSETIAKYGLNHNDILALQQFAQNEAQFTVMNRRTWLKGQGQVSDNESAMVAQLGPQHTDDPAVIRMKAEAVKLKADFEEHAYEAWVDYHDKGGSFSKFLVSPEYKSVKNDYNKRLGVALKANAEYLSGKPGAKKESAPAAAEPKNKTLAEQLKESLSEE